MTHSFFVALSKPLACLRMDGSPLRYVLSYRLWCLLPLYLHSDRLLLVCGLLQYFM